MDGSAVILRDALPSDALALAELIDIAGAGIPRWLWTQLASPGQTALDIGVQRAVRESGGFSYRRAFVAAKGCEVAGMALCYILDAPTEAERADLPKLPAPIRPFVELEFEKASIGTFYLNAVAVLPRYRRRGIGSKLLAEAERRARTLGADATSVQVFSQNTGAVQLYQRLGYREVARRPVILHPCEPWYDEHVVLLVKDLPERSLSDKTRSCRSP